MEQTTVTLYKPYPHQKAVHDAITEHITKNKRFTTPFQKIFPVKACRQVGKSAMAINELSRFALTFKDSTNGYIAPTLKLSRKTYDEMLKMFSNSPLVQKTNAQDLIITFVNGATVQFFSGEQRDNLRGYTISGLLVVDEAAFIRNDIWNECISPWVDAKKAVTIIISTPKFKTGFFYDLFTAGENGGTDMVYSTDFTLYDLTAIRSNEIMENKRKTMSSQAFRSEYLGEFLDAEGAVFGKFADILQDEQPKFKKLYLGLDFGTGSGEDYTVLTGLNENGEQVFTWRTNDLSPTEQVEKIAEIVLGFKYQERHPVTGKMIDVNPVKGFYAEQNSIGKVYLDMLRGKGITVHPFNTTATSKTRLVQKLQVAIEQKKIKLLNDPVLLTQMALYESKLNAKTNYVSYNAPAGEHDDDVMALMIAYECFRVKQITGRIR